MSGQDSYGLFEAPKIMSPGQPGADSNDKSMTRQRPSSAGLKPFLTSPAKKGHTPDVTFSKFTSLSVGDHYVSKYELDKSMSRVSSGKSTISPKPFRPSSPSKIGAGKGSYFGTLGGVIQHEKEWDDSPKRPMSASKGKNFVTSPSKKGSYGTPGLHIGAYSGQGSGMQGFSGEYAYVDSPPQPKGKGAQTPLKAWRPSSPGRRGTFGTADTHLTFSKFSYSSDPVQGPKRKDGNVPSPKPFVPSSPSRRGPGYGTINRFPEYKGDSDKDMMETQKKDAQLERSKRIGPVFRPTSHPKSMRQVSIISHPMNTPK